MASSQLDFDINAPVAPEKGDHRTAFTLRIHNGASVEEVELALKGGANPFVGSPSAIETFGNRVSVDQLKGVAACLLHASPEFSMEEGVANHAYRSVLRLCPDEKTRAALLSVIGSRSPGVEFDHRNLVVHTLAIQFSPQGRPAASNEKLSLFQEVSAWEHLTKEEFLVLAKSNLNSWPVLQTLLDKVPPADRLEVWKQGLHLPNRTGEKGGWVPRFIRYAQQQPGQKMLRYCCQTWCSEATCPETEPARVGLAQYLLSSLDIPGTTNPVRVFPNTARWLFPAQDIAQAFDRQNDSLWSSVLGGYNASDVKGHNQAHTDDRLELARWLLEQPQPSLDKTYGENYSVFMSWEGLAEIVEKHSMGSTDRRAERLAELGSRLIELGAANNWSDEEYYRAPPFKHPVLRGIQEMAASQERAARLEETLPQVESSRRRGPRF